MISEVQPDDVKESRFCDSNNYYGVFANDGCDEDSRGFITCTDGKFEFRWGYSITKGNVHPVPVPNESLREIIDGVIKLGWEVHEFKTHCEMFDWLSEEN